MTLSGLSIGSATFEPAFDPTKTGYTNIQTASDTDSTVSAQNPKDYQITATPREQTATVAYYWYDPEGMGSWKELSDGVLTLPDNLMTATSTGMVAEVMVTVSVDGLSNNYYVRLVLTTTPPGPTPG